MKIVKKLLISTLLVISPFSFADSATEHASHASKHSVLASGHTLASGTQVASAVVAIPVIASAGVVMTSAAVEQAVSDSLNQSVAHHNKNAPLVITEIVVTVEPTPAEAMKKAN